MRGVPRQKTKFLKVPSRDDLHRKDQKELLEITKEQESSTPNMSKPKVKPKPK
jgi:hypothetical protein